MAFQMEPERTQSGAGDEGPKREPPDDNLEGTEAKVGCGGWCLSGNCVAMATKREPVCYVIFFFFTEAVSGNIKQENGVYFSIVMVQ